MKPIFKKPKMNRLEQRYADNLELKKIAGEIIDWKFNAIRFRLAEGAYYKPDFFIVYPDRFEIHETKGHWREAARVRIKTAAELYPWFKWVAVKWDAKGGWQFEHFG
jgi:hypothetical protein